MSRPPLYIVRSYLIKEIIKRALILDLRRVVSLWEGENRVATWFRSRNQIEHFGLLTYMHRFAYHIMGLEFRYSLGRC